MMVCGASGTGRTTFVNTLCSRNVLSHEASKAPADASLQRYVNNITVL